MSGFRSQIATRAPNGLETRRRDAAPDARAAAGDNRDAVGEKDA